MSKRLPYYQSEPAEYLSGDIMFCSYAAQGVFTIARALYWQKDCKLTLTQLNRRLRDAEKEIKELIKENIIKIENDNVSISFLDEQYEKASGISIANSENGKKGAAKRWANKENNSPPISESIAPPLKNDSESIALREDKEDKEDNINTFTHESFLIWFKECREYLGLKYNVKKLSYLDKQLFNELKEYTKEDFKLAFKNFSKDKYYKENNLLFPNYFLKTETFTKYLNAEVKTELTLGEKLMGRVQ
jgi:hypothetical protein